jgi:hypothetical protein
MSVQAYFIPPDETDAKILRSDNLNMVILDREVEQGALLVFMGGANSYRKCTHRPLFEVALKNGYRIISLDYQYEPPANANCWGSADDECYARNRASKTFGLQGVVALHLAPEECIENRLARLLIYLTEHHPDAGWERYLDGNSVRWNRISVSGHSQGAGLAAYIAKEKEVFRTVLFSSPWDHYPERQMLAPWLHKDSFTQYAKWFGSFHVKESNAEMLEKSFAALKIPAANIRRFDRDPVVPEWLAQDSRADPYHISVVSSYASPQSPNGEFLYQDDWSFLLGSAYEN